MLYSSPLPSWPSLMAERELGRAAVTATTDAIAARLYRGLARGPQQGLKAEDRCYEHALHHAGRGEGQTGGIFNLEFSPNG